jgi:protein-serine/threonine kinase
MSEKKLSKLGKLFNLSLSNLTLLDRDKHEKGKNKDEKLASPNPLTTLKSPKDDTALSPIVSSHSIAHSLKSLHSSSNNSPNQSTTNLVDTHKLALENINEKLEPHETAVAGSGSAASSQKPGVKPRNNSGSTSRLSSPPLSRSNSVMNKPRFRLTETSHEHNLRSAKRQEKLSNMLKDLLGAKRLRDEAKLAVPNILGENQSVSPTNGTAQLPPALPSQLPSQIQLPIPAAAAGAGGVPQPSAQAVPPARQPPTLFAGLVNQVKSFHDSQPATSTIDQSFVEKYGRCQEVIGKGSFGTVRVSHKRLTSQEGSEEMLYAVKEFKKRQNELEKKFNRRLTSEFCISSSLKHINIIDTLDLLKDAKGDYVEVMEFCSGGDLYTLIIASGKLEYAEADCFFKQLIKGVNYMHDMGVSHRDLKPENLLLTQNGVLKITDFGNSECFKMAWENTVQLSEGICGSSPYIAPEEFTAQQFDSRCVDIWSCGVIYMAMRTGRQLWSIADPEKDEFFKEYLAKRKNSTGYEPIESLKRARCRNVIYSILDPKPARRITGKQILNSEWGREIKLCEAALGNA